MRCGARACNAAGAAKMSPLVRRFHAALSHVMLLWSERSGTRRLPSRPLYRWSMIFFGKTGIHPRIKSEGKLFGIML
jgi:hypothetical protein